MSPRGQGETGQGGHGVAAPVAKPMAAGDDRLLVPARDDVLVGGCGQGLGNIVFRRTGNIVAAGDFRLTVFGHLCDIALFG
jgi:hypothetical protein